MTLLNPTDIADQFAKFFFNAESTLPPLNEVVLDRLPHSFFPFPTTPGELLSVIGTLKMTSAGLDGIHSSHIKMVAHLI